MNSHVAQPVTCLRHSECARGFTLIELMISMAIGLVILAGISAMFISYGKTSTAVSARTERMGDLYMASQIMQAELRMGQDVCWDAANSRIIYQPLDGTVVLGACTSVDADNGSFELRAADPGNDKPTPYVCWDRPSVGGGCQELIRDLATTNGMSAVQSASGTWTVTMGSSYVDEERKGKNMTLSFNTWPRNE